MPQKLTIEVTSADGTKSQKQVMVIRSWQDASGHALFLFGNGSYGYKNGEPVREESEFGIIGTPIQRKSAMAWWNRAGKELSRRYYEAKANHEARLMGDFAESPAGGESKFDQVLYYRAPVADRSAVEGPFDWPSLFNKRPDWWGQARQIVFADYGYIQQDALDDEDRPAGINAGPPAMAGLTEGVKEPVIQGQPPDGEQVTAPMPEGKEPVIEVETAAGTAKAGGKNKQK